MITLHNRNSSIPIEVKSSDGDSVTIMPGAKQPVNDKFGDWTLPRDVVVVRSTTTTFGKKQITEKEDEEATLAKSANINASRETVRTVEDETTDNSTPKSTTQYTK